MRFLLLQVRDDDDAMRDHERRVFSRALRVDEQRVRIFDLLNNALTQEHLGEADALLLGGSGAYSAVGDSYWLHRALESLRLIYEWRVPTFASCWGCQAMARAMGGKVANDPDLAEVGSFRMFLTNAARKDRLFGALPPEFFAQQGHEDSVIELPPETTLLASSERVRNQAYRFNDRPIYCTQFHPELRRADLELRLEAYPDYIRRVSGLPIVEFVKTLQETPEAESLLARFVDAVT